MIPRIPHYAYLLALSTAPLIVFFAAMIVHGEVFEDFRRAHRVLDLMIEFGFFGVAIACMLLGKRVAKRYRARIDEHQGHLCPSCDYPLIERRPSWHCPECGREYSDAWLQQKWFRIKRWLGESSSVYSRPPDRRV